MRKMLVLLAWLLPLVLVDVASAKLPPFSFEATPASPRVGEPITLTMRCFEDVGHTRPWLACFGDRGTMAWVHPLDDEGALDRHDWIPIEGRAMPSGATRGTVVLSEPGPYLITPLWRSWAGEEHAPGFPDAIRLEVEGDAARWSVAGVLVPIAALTAPAVPLAFALARRRLVRRGKAAIPDRRPGSPTGISKGRKAMRSRVLVAGLVAMSTVLIVVPASAKVDIAKGTITGPGLAAKIKIKAPDARGLWESGIDLAGELDDALADSVEELGLTSVDLGPRYRVTYTFFRDDRIRQDLFPYAKGGPVTYTPPGQRVAEGQPWGGWISAGWYQGSPEFLRFLVDYGLPEQDPVPPVTLEEVAPSTTPVAGTAPGAGIVALLAGLALSLAAVAVRRRALAVGRANR